MTRLAAGVILLLFALCGISAGRRDLVEDVIRLPSEMASFFHPDGVHDAKDEDSTGTKWAILLAGSSGYWNYRHQVMITP